MDLTPRGLMVLMTPMINKQVRAEVANLGNLPAAMGARALLAGPGAFAGLDT